MSRTVADISCPLDCWRLLFRQAGRFRLARDTVTEWPGWTPLGSARKGLTPFGVDVGLLQQRASFFHAHITIWSLCDTIEVYRDITVYHRSGTGQSGKFFEQCFGSVFQREFVPICPCTLMLVLRTYVGFHLCHSQGRQTRPRSDHGAVLTNPSSLRGPDEDARHGPTVEKLEVFLLRDTPGRIRFVEACRVPLTRSDHKDSPQDPPTEHGQVRGQVQIRKPVKTTYFGHKPEVI